MLEDVFKQFTLERGISAVRRDQALVAKMPGAIIAYERISSWESLTAQRGREYAYVAMHDPQQGNFLRVAIVHPCLRDYLTMLWHHDQLFTTKTVRQHFERYLTMPFSPSTLHQAEFAGLRYDDFKAVLDCFHPQE